MRLNPLTHTGRTAQAASLKHHAEQVKSLIIGKICHDSITHDVRVLVVTHRKKLLEQNEAELKTCYLSANTGFIGAGLNQKHRTHKLYFAGSKTSPMPQFQHYEILIIDECHLVAPSEAGQSPTH